MRVKCLAHRGLRGGQLREPLSDFDNPCGVCTWLCGQAKPSRLSQAFGLEASVSHGPHGDQGCSRSSRIPSPTASPGVWTECLQPALPAEVSDSGERGGRKDKEAEFCDQKLPQALSRNRRNCLCREKGCRRDSCLVEPASLQIQSLAPGST